MQLLTGFCIPCAVLARLMSPQVIEMFINLLPEGNDLPWVDVSRFAEQINKSGVINLIIKFISEIDNHPKTYQGLINQHRHVRSAVT